jgi:hypothetical protein
MTILDQTANSDDLDTIRKVLDFSLTKTNLTDAVILLSAFLPQAEIEVKARVTTWAAILAGDDDETVKLKNAVIYTAAAKLAPSSIVATALNVQARDMSYTRPAYNGQRRQAELLADADSLIDDLTSVATPDMPTMFARATGRRGQY